MELLHTFGIDPVLLIAQFINFAIVILLLKKFLYKPILSMLKTREEEIKRGVADAEKARQVLEETVQKEKKILQAAQSDAKKLIDEAKKQAEYMLEEARKESKKQTDQMIKEARNQIISETKLAEKQLATHVAKLAIDFLDISIRDVFTEKDRNEVMERAIKKIKGGN
jgi:F-type H+-transporting ATPase subunit b